jgi:hypothetical protein
MIVRCSCPPLHGFCVPVSQSSTLVDGTVYDCAGSFAAKAHFGEDGTHKGGVECRDF